MVESNNVAWVKAKTLPVRGNRSIVSSVNQSIILCDKQVSGIDAGLHREKIVVCRILYHTKHSRTCIEEQSQWSPVTRQYLGCSSKDSLVA